jgi:hypothetical protein
MTKNDKGNSHRRGHTGAIGTFRTSRNVRLESVMRTKADVRQDAADVAAKS